MAEEQKQTIVRLRNVGLGYRKIAIVLDSSSALFVMEY